MQSFILSFVLITFLFLCLPPMLIIETVCQQRLYFLYSYIIAKTHCGANDCSHLHYTQNTITQMTQTIIKHNITPNNNFKSMFIIEFSPYYQIELISVLITQMKRHNYKRSYRWYLWSTHTKIQYL